MSLAGWTVVLLASLDRGTLFVEHPQLSFKVPAVFGKPATPTPAGIYLIERAHSSKLGMDILVFRREGNAVFAIHPNLKSRQRQLESGTPADNFLSGGCIGVEDSVFEKLWGVKQTMVLQVY